MRPPLPRDPVHGHADGSPLPLELRQCPLPPRGSFARERPPEPVDLGDAEGPQLHVEETPGLLSRARPGFVEREAPRREIPDPLLAGPARDHDLSLGPQDLEHHRGVPAVVVPPTGPPADRGAILECPGGQGPLVAQPLQDVPPEPRVLAEVPADVRVPPAAGTRVAPHRLPMHGELRGREDERPVLEQRPIPPQEPLELVDPEPTPEPRPEHEVLRACHRPRRVHLHAAQTLDDFEDRPRPRRRQQLRGHSQAPRPLERDRTRFGRAHPACSAASASCFVRWTVPSGCSGGE